MDQRQPKPTLCKKERVPGEIVSIPDCLEILQADKGDAIAHG
jgi:hypothetical protein